MTIVRQTPRTAATVTAPRRRRLVIRAPFLPDMRARLARCGGTPQWEIAAEVWTMPRTSLAPVVDELLDAFGAAVVRLEVERGDDADPADTVWLNYELSADAEQPVEWLVHG